jgi:hypothetical protein
MGASRLKVVGTFFPEAVMQDLRQIRSPSANDARAGRERPGRSPSSLASRVIAAILIAVGLPATAQASQFNPPSLEGFSPSGEHDVDGDGDGVNETHVQQYHNAAGDSIYSMTTNGHVWAWSLETKGESTNGPQNYVIRDSDCDGIFDEVYGLDDEYYLPDCVKK